MKSECTGEKFGKFECNAVILQLAVHGLARGQFGMTAVNSARNQKGDTGQLQLSRYSGACGWQASGMESGCFQDEENNSLRAVSVIADTAGCLMRRSAEMA